MILDREEDKGEDGEVWMKKSSLCMGYNHSYGYFHPEIQLRYGTPIRLLICVELSGKP